jgi:hypothetical protein
MGPGPRHGGYRVVDPSAYAGSAPVPVGDVAAVAGVQGGLLLALVVWHGPFALLLFGVATLFNLRRAPWPWRRDQAPLVVDRPGVYVAGAGDEGRLVHWESIDAVVLCDVTSRRSAHRRLVPGVGLRLRGNAGVVAIRRPLDGWRIDERRLLAAVARFAPPGVAVVREGPLGEVFTLREAAEDVARRAADAALQRATERLRARAAAPAAPPDGPPGGRQFAVGPEGVHLGPVPGRGGGRPGRLVPWADVAAVVVFDAQTASGWHRAVGVAPAGGRGLAPRELIGYRVAADWPLDRLHLEDAVRLHAPQVPVVDGPPLRRAGPGDLAAAVTHGYRRRHEERDSRRNSRDEPA